jgi:mRNA interferase MazF
MKRGELWVARADLYSSKARPVLIVQSDQVAEYDSIITCLVTSYEKPADRLRLKLEPTEKNGLMSVSYVMFDKIFSFDKADLERKIGELPESTMDAVSQGLRDILGL